MKAATTTRLRMIRQLSAALHDKALEWSVAACGPGYGGGLVVAGAANADCSWSSRRALNGDRAMAWTLLSCTGPSCRVAANQPVRRFAIPGPLPAPQLIAPAAGALEPRDGDRRFPLGALVESDLRGPTTYPASITFEWSRGTGATGYRLCISEPGVACGTGTSVVTDARGQGSESVPWSSLAAFHGRTVNWTVASCDALGCGTFASPRPLTIKTVPGPVTLIAPPAGTDVTSLPSQQRVQFSWSSPMFAETFLIEVGQRVQGYTSTPSCSAPKAAFAELRGTTSWTVQACNVLGCGPVSAANDITLYPAGAPTLRAGTSSASQTPAHSGAAVGRPTALTLCQ